MQKHISEILCVLNSEYNTRFDSAVQAARAEKFDVVIAEVCQAAGIDYAITVIERINFEANATA